MATLTADQARQVLTLVKDQPGFRDALMNDPAATLTGIGIAHDASDIPSQVTLPSDDAIRDRLDEFSARLALTVIRQLLQLGD